MVQALFKITLAAVVLPSWQQLHPIFVIDEAEALLSLRFGCVTRVHDGNHLISCIKAILTLDMLQLVTVPELPPALIVVACCEPQGSLKSSARSSRRSKTQAVATAIVAEEEVTFSIYTGSLQLLAATSDASLKLEVITCGHSLRDYLWSSSIGDAAVNTRCLQNTLHITLPRQHATLVVPDLVRIAKIYAIAIVKDYLSARCRIKAEAGIARLDFQSVSQLLCVEDLRTVLFHAYTQHKPSCTLALNNSLGTHAIWCF